MGKLKGTRREGRDDEELGGTQPTQPCRRDRPHPPCLASAHNFHSLLLTAARRRRLLPIDTAIVTPQPGRPKPPAHRGPLPLQLTQLRFSIWAILITLAQLY